MSQGDHLTSGVTSEDMESVTHNIPELQVVPEVQDARWAEISETSSSASGSGPLFVIGMWRSGTSLLYALLNKHPKIALMYEGDILLLRALFWVPGASSRWLRRWEFWNTGLGRHGLDARQFPGDVSGIRAAAEQAYREYARKKGALIGGDKSPNYFDSMTRLSKDFPDARFIVIWRDPASICRSVTRAAEEEHSWFDRTGMTLRVLLGMEAMRAECDRLVRRGARVHELQYRDLVQNPVETLAGICTFLGISFAPEMASLEGADRSAIYDGGHHALVKGERIVAPGERAEVLPGNLKSKIERYMSLWREEYSEKWPASFFQGAADTGKPSLAERLLDRVRFRSLRTFDAAVVLVYCFAPFWVLRRFRALKHRREEERAKVRRTAASSPRSI